MKCKKCGKEVSEGQKICPECKTRQKRKRPLILVILSLVLSVAIVFSSGIVAFSVFNSELKKEEETSTAAPSVPTPEEIEEPQPDLTGSATIKVQIDDENCYAGEDSTVYFRAYTENKVDSVRLVKTEDNTEITTLTICEPLPDGSWCISGEYTFTPDTEGKINFRAYAGSEFSDETYINVYHLFSEDDYNEYDELTASLDNYLASADFEELTAEEELETVKQWLEAYSSVAQVVIDGSNIVYTTVGGISGYYSVSFSDELMGTDSLNNDFRENTVAVEYFEKWTDDSSSLMDDDNHISYLPAENSITNDKTLFLIPTKHSNNGFQRSCFDDIVSLVNNSDKLESRATVCDSFDETMDAIRNRDLVEYGSVYLCAHGGNDGNYNFLAYESENKKEHDSIRNEYEKLIRSTGDNWEILFGSKKEDGKVIYTVSVSARYIMNHYRGYTFDNTMFVFFSCKGLSDTVFNEFLQNNKVQLLIGAMQNLFFLSVETMIDTVFEQMYNEPDNTKGSFISAWSNFIESGSIEVSLTNKVITVDEYLENQKKNVKWMERESKKDLANAAVNGRIADEERINRYLQWGFTDHIEDIEITVYREDTVLEDGSNREAGTFDIRMDLFNGLLFMCNTPLNLGGSGSISGTLYEGTVTRVISSDGSYTDTEKKGEILSDTDISAYRFLNQGFDKELTVTSAEDGSFTFSPEEDDFLHWGHYVIASADEDYDGEASIIFIDDAVNGGEIILHGGNSTISGIAQGEKSASDKTVVALEEAYVRLVDSEGDVIKGTAVDKNGAFTVNDIDDGDYILRITCDKYEELSVSVTVENGYAYEYQTGCLVLKPVDSIMDVVLVLDISGSMTGEPIDATKKAASQFADTVLGAEKSCKVGLVVYETSAKVKCGFTKYTETISPVIDSIYTMGSTNISDGLSKARTMLSESSGRNKIIVLMSDGLPNNGKEGQSLIDYASDIKDDGIIIYTIGFFSEIPDEETRRECRSLMNAIASRGYHYEGTSLAELTSFFNDMAVQASEKPMIHVEVACPVDVTVTYNGETLSSAEDSLCTRTSFGTLMFDGDESDPTKILRLEEGIEYNIEIVGTGKGKMDYSISFADENGSYSDIRTFSDVKITKNFTAVTTTQQDKATVMKIDEDGDGKTDIIYEGENSKPATVTNAKEFAQKVMKITAIVTASLFGIVILIIIIKKGIPAVKKMKSRAEERKKASPEKVAVPGKKTAPVKETVDGKKTPPVKTGTAELKFCPECGGRLPSGATFCGSCGKSLKKN